MITLGGSAAALLISGQPLLRPWLPLAALLPAFSVCVCLCVYTSSVVEPVCIHSIFVPSVCASDLFPALAVPSIRRAWLSSACQPAACEVLARRLSSSPLLCQLLSLPLSAREQKTNKNSLMSGWLSEEPFIAAHYRLLAFILASSFLSVNLRLKCWGRLQLIVWHARLPSWLK